MTRNQRIAYNAAAIITIIAAVTSTILIAIFAITTSMNLINHAEITNLPTQITLVTWAVAMMHLARSANMFRLSCITCNTCNEESIN